MLVETQLAEDRAKKTMIDTARLAGINLFYGYNDDIITDGFLFIF